MPNICFLYCTSCHCGPHTAARIKSKAQTASSFQLTLARCTHCTLANEIQFMHSSLSLSLCHMPLIASQNGEKRQKYWENGKFINWYYEYCWNPIPSHSIPYSKSVVVNRWPRTQQQKMVHQFHQLRGRAPEAMYAYVVFCSLLSLFCCC